jgi:hypothetical protein
MDRAAVNLTMFSRATFALTALYRTGVVAMPPAHYNHHRPHSALADRTPNEFATIGSGGKDGDRAALENAARFPLSLRMAAAEFSLKSDPSSSLLLEAVT